MSGKRASDFQAELDTVFTFAREKKLSSITIQSGHLHGVIGDYPDPIKHRMSICCNVMRYNMITGDEILFEPPSGQGASLLIKYKFPR